MKKAKADYIITALGILLLVFGVYLIKSGQDTHGIMRALPYVCIGLGCGIFGHGMGDIISRKAIQTDPKLEKQIEIQKNDERNITISQRAKAKAYDLMTFVYGALMLTFALMGVDMITVLLLVFAYLFVQGYAVYFRCKYDKEM